MQYGLAEFLKNEDHYNGLPAFYQQKRDFFADLLKPSRFTPVLCHGTYFQLYAYENISSESDIEFANRLTTEHGVALIPTSVFYENGQDIKYLRFCFAKKEKTLERAAERLCKI